jgi:hypothetical protein
MVQQACITSRVQDLSRRIGRKQQIGGRERKLAKSILIRA